MLLQGVLALESFTTALCFTDEPGVSFTGLLMLLKAGTQETEEEEEERAVTVRLCTCVCCAVYRL